MVSGRLNKRFTLFLLIVFSFSVAMVVNSLIPFYTLPTLGQTIWSLGFAKSIANGPLLGVTAHNFGYPVPSAISFGLSAVLPMSWLFRLSVSPAQVYNFIFIFWMSVAFGGAIKLLIKLGIPRHFAIVSSMVWLITPVVVQHASYSMLSLGMALVPFYFYTSLIFFRALKTVSLTSNVIFTFLLYLCSGVISVFMDGYTFMMFAVSSSLLFLFEFIIFDRSRIKIIFVAALAHSFVFAISYLLYALYIGKPHFDTVSMDFFRGWGVDISYLLLPTIRTSWFSDVLGMSIHRTPAHLFGDNSVWMTSFIFPLVLVTLFSVSKRPTFRKNQYNYVFIVITIIAIYLALGPSINFFSAKPAGEELTPEMLSGLMPERYAMIPTGNAFISKYIPGFDAMRASYRWICLAFLGTWVISVLYLNQLRNIYIKWGILLFIALIYIPPVKMKTQFSHQQYDSIGEITKSLISPLRHEIASNEKVAFVPWGNDFFANYISSFSGFITYNIGGDKNLVISAGAWPVEMYFLRDELQEKYLHYIISLLRSGDVNTIVIPYFDMLWSAHRWPCPVTGLLSYTSSDTGSAHPANYLCPEFKKVHLAAQLKTLKDLSFLQVTDSELYSTIRLKSYKMPYPVMMDPKNLTNYSILGAGWYNIESGHVWSKDHAQLILPPPDKNCQRCSLRLSYEVFSSSPERPLKVNFQLAQAGIIKNQTVVYAKGNTITTDFDIPDATKDIYLTITVPDSTSPSKLNNSPDTRVLGISLNSVDVVHIEH